MAFLGLQCLGNMLQLVCHNINKTAVELIIFIPGIPLVAILVKLELSPPYKISEG
jgi:hypothetical protein